MNVMTDEDKSMYEEINVELLDVNVSKSVHSFISARPSFGDMNGSSVDVQLIEVGVKKGMTGMNQPNSIPESPYVDEMVPKDVVPEEGDSSTREM